MAWVVTVSNVSITETPQTSTFASSSLTASISSLPADRPSLTDDANKFVDKLVPGSPVVTGIENDVSDYKGKVRFLRKNTSAIQNLI